MVPEDRPSLTTHSTKAGEKMNTLLGNSALELTCLLSDLWGTQQHSSAPSLGTDGSPALSLLTRVSLGERTEGE